jgi:glycosyltransferase involved in cell wall biosynthesis
MKIAFIDHLPVGTGIIRLASKLARSLVETDKNVELTFFTHWSNFQNNKELFDFKTPNFKLEILASTFPKNRIYPYYEKALKKIGITDKNRLKKELESIVGFDVIYFTSAHMSRYYNIEGIKFATFHDFNWKYAFGSANFSKKTLHAFNESMPSWFESTVPVVSSDFIKKEIDKFYPLHKYPVEVVYLPNIGNEVEVFSKRIYDFPYILYPANICSHKNHLNLYHGLAILKNANKLNGTKLILTGAGTDHFTYGKLSNTGLEEGDKDDFDVLGLGYVHNDVMDNLIKYADLNISVSIYEAASGPAIDAWINKVPFIMSDIEPHRNQLDFFKLECILFDPFNTDDIADKIDFALSNPVLLKQMSEKGYHALKVYNWNAAAKNYLTIFKKYATGN